MNTVPGVDLQLQNQAVDKVIDRWGKALNCLCDKSHPHWQRVQLAMRAFAGLPLDNLPPNLERRLTRAFARMNTVLANHPIETWDDYQKIPPDDLTQLEILILNMPPKGRRVTTGAQLP